MLEKQPNESSSCLWVEVRVDDGNESTSRHTTSYIGRLEHDILDAWTRIEHGEYWFLLTDVLWYYSPPAKPDAPPRNWLTSLLNEDPESSDNIEPEPAFRPLIRQSQQADYWGYADRIYLRLDRVYRIIPLSAEYIEQAVIPALERHPEKTIP